MAESLKISIIQSDLYWEDIQSNLKMFTKNIGSISDKPDLIILPEMFTTGFTMNASLLAEEENGATLSWMKNEAKKNQAAITGSYIVADNGNYFNRLFFVYPDGEYIKYDKRHTFTLANEHKTYSSGNEQIYVNYLGWKIFPLICYDIRFPVWSRNTVKYDVLIYVASWPKKRISAWDALLKARAIENMCYTIGVNRVGEDGNGHQYTGHSVIYDVLGERISTEDHEKEFIETCVLERSHLDLHRKHLQFLNDRDEFNLM